ncbi:MAG: DSD1 family PLP-dependent enzyme [Candidatus Latescibacteria bacterium]|nr:DSD1 family PLP-dependent enzyme [Candidatus Latescibacterota bacterium]
MNMDLHDTETPCCIVDISRVRANINHLHQRLEKLGVGLRPHGKTVKNIRLIRMALKGQPGGIAVSTLREAEYYFSNGITDITYAVGITPSKLDRVAELAGRGARMSVILDTIEQVRALGKAGRELGAALPFLIEIDCDGLRGGIGPDDPLLIEMGTVAEHEEGAELTGVLTHAGGSYHCDSVGEIRKMAEREREYAVRAAERLRSSGLSCPVVSVGSTPTAYFAASLDGVTEVRAGVFMFQDLMMAGLGVCSVDEIALSVLTSVTGYQKERGWIITDAGWMALSNAPAGKYSSGFGIPRLIDGESMGDFTVTSTSQEHGIISSLAGLVPNYNTLEIGSRLRILPNHACATAAMHSFYYTVEGGTGITGKLERTGGW